jgi:peptidoglycan/LPS O-acetylase OafA/YrhL
MWNASGAKILHAILAHMPEDLSTVTARPASPYSAHILALDGLRGLAILAVMGSHLFPGTVARGGWAVRAIGSLLPIGASGVDLFFVLSGFLITGILYDSLAEEHFFRTFYMRRALRIFPLYYGVIFLLLILTPLLKIPWHGMQWSLMAYLQNTNVAMPLYKFHPGPYIGIDQMWSLAVEEQFYLVWPMVVFFVRKRSSLIAICLVGSIASLVLRFELFQHGVIYDVVNRSTLCRADGLLTGAAFALLVRGRLHDRVLRWAPTVFWIALAIGVGQYEVPHLLHLTLTPFYESYYVATRYTVMELLSAALLCWSLWPASLPRKVFEASILRFFGKYSYGLYMTHQIPLPVLLPLFRGWAAIITASKAFAVAFAGVLSGGVGVGVAYTSYHAYEKHFLRLKKYFAYKKPRSKTRAADA